MTPPTREQVEALLALDEKATPGPWATSPENPRLHKFVEGPSTNDAIPSPDVVCTAAYSDRYFEDDDANMDLIAAARNLIRPLAEAYLAGLDAKPIDMILQCPACGLQHIDAPSEGWDNPPHRSHLCHGCGSIWRPADVATNGVEHIKTFGSADTPRLIRTAPAAILTILDALGKARGEVERLSSEEQVVARTYPDHVTLEVALRDRIAKKDAELATLRAEVERWRGEGDALLAKLEDRKP